MKNAKHKFGEKFHNFDHQIVSKLVFDGTVYGRVQWVWERGHPLEGTAMIAYKNVDGINNYRSSKLEDLVIVEEF